MNSFISWVGGKKLLRKEIIKKFPKEEIEKYVEPFGGAIGAARAALAAAFICGKAEPGKVGFQ